jgi:D-alanyl-lipoteichoic acid acyltransferase DltB (MBOAT superfamily)
MGLNAFLFQLLAGLGLFTLFLLAIRLLPDFARNLTLLLASLAAIEIFTSPFYTFGLVAATGLIYYALFWLQWNSRKALFCRLIAAALVIALLATMTLFRLGAPWAGASVPVLAATFLTLRLLSVAVGVGRGRPLPSDPLEFFVYAFFFPTFFIGPLEHLDDFRKNLTAEHRPALSWSETGLQLIRIAVGLGKGWLALRLVPSEVETITVARVGLGALGLTLGLSALYDLVIGCTGLTGYRLLKSLNAFPLGTLASRAFPLHLAVVGGVILWIERLFF